MKISQELANQIFLKARTANGFLDTPIPLSLLEEIYNLAKMGPTSMNTQPARYIFLTTPESKQFLSPILKPSNVDKVNSAPVTVVVAIDTQFYDHMPDIWHVPDAKQLFMSNPELANQTGVRNGTLGGAYFMIAARALGLDCGPISGVDLSEVDKALFPDGKWKTNFLINLGYIDQSKTYPRNPRLPFNKACKIL
jgi:nitroreductase